jgi:undecaprenyl-diphosphatase
VIGVALIGLAILLWLAERYSRRRGNLDTLGFWSVQVIGLCQALALIPGCSRSGSTIMGGLLVGLDRAEAARFSFLLGLPAILGSGLFELWELSHSGFGNHGTLPLLLGIGSAFVCGWVAIEFLLRFLRTHGTLVFVLYRLLLGSVILATLP